MKRAVDLCWPLHTVPCHPQDLLQNLYHVMLAMLAMPIPNIPRKSPEQLLGL